MWRIIERLPQPITDEIHKENKYVIDILILQLDKGVQLYDSRLLIQSLKQLQFYISQKYFISGEERIKLIKIINKLLYNDGTASPLPQQFISSSLRLNLYLTYSKLLKKRIGNKLEKNEIKKEINWRIIYEKFIENNFIMKDKEYVGIERKIYLIRTELNLIKKLRNYFQAKGDNTIEELTELFFSKINEKKGIESIKSLFMFNLFFPKLIKDQKIESIKKLIEKISEIWKYYENKYWDYLIIDLITRIADQIYFIENKSDKKFNLFSGQFLSFFYTKIIHLLKISVASQKSREKRVKNPENQFISENRFFFPRNINEKIYSRAGKFIIFTLSDDASLENYKKCKEIVKNYFYPSNQGNWESKLGNLLFSTSKNMEKRLFFENNENFKCKKIISTKMIEKFLTIQLEINLQAIYSKNNSFHELGTKSLANLFSIQSFLIASQENEEKREENENFLVDIIENELFKYLRNANSPKQLISTIHCFSAILFIFLKEKKINKSKKKEIIEKLMTELIPGLDNNDLVKSNKTIQFYLVLFVSLSEAAENSIFYLDFSFFNEWNIVFQDKWLSFVSTVSLKDEETLFGNLKLFFEFYLNFLSFNQIKIQLKKLQDYFQINSENIENKKIFFFIYKKFIEKIQLKIDKKQLKPFKAGNNDSDWKKEEENPQEIENYPKIVFGNLIDNLISSKDDKKIVNEILSEDKKSNTFEYIVRFIQGISVDFWVKNEENQNKLKETLKIYLENENSSNGLHKKVYKIIKIVIKKSSGIQLLPRGNKGKIYSISNLPEANWFVPEDIHFNFARSLFDFYLNFVFSEVKNIFSDETSDNLKNHSKKARIQEKIKNLSAFFEENAENQIKVPEKNEKNEKNTKKTRIQRVLWLLKDLIKNGKNLISNKKENPTEIRCLEVGERSKNLFLPIFIDPPVKNTEENSRKNKQNSEKIEKIISIFFNYFYYHPVPPPDLITIFLKLLNNFVNYSVAENENSFRKYFLKYKLHKEKFNFLLDAENLQEKQIYQRYPAFVFFFYLKFYFEKRKMENNQFRLNTHRFLHYLIAFSTFSFLEIRKKSQEYFSNHFSIFYHQIDENLVEIDENVMDLEETSLVSSEVPSEAFGTSKLTRNKKKLTKNSNLISYLFHFYSQIENSSKFNEEEKKERKSGVLNLLNNYFIRHKINSSESLILKKMELILSENSVSNLQKKVDNSNSMLNSIHSMEIYFSFIHFLNEFNYLPSPHSEELLFAQKYQTIQENAGKTEEFEVGKVLGPSVASSLSEDSQKSLICFFSSPLADSQFYFENKSKNLKEIQLKMKEIQEKIETSLESHSEGKHWKELIILLFLYLFLINKNQCSGPFFLFTNFQKIISIFLNFVDSEILILRKISLIATNFLLFNYFLALQQLQTSGKWETMENFANIKQQNFEKIREYLENKEKMGKVQKYQSEDHSILSEEDEAPKNQGNNRFLGKLIEKFNLQAIFHGNSSSSNQSSSSSNLNLFSPTSIEFHLKNLIKNSVSYDFFMTQNQIHQRNSTSDLFSQENAIFYFYLFLNIFQNEKNLENLENFIFQFLENQKIFEKIKNNFERKEQILALEILSAILKCYFLVFKQNLIEKKQKLPEKFAEFFKQLFSGEYSIIDFDFASFIRFSLSEFDLFGFIHSKSTQSAGSPPPSELFNLFSEFIDFSNANFLENSDISGKCYRKLFYLNEFFTCFQFQFREEVLKNLFSNFIRFTSHSSFQIRCELAQLYYHLFFYTSSVSALSPSPNPFSTWFLNEITSHFKVIQTSGSAFGESENLSNQREFILNFIRTAFTNQLTIRLISSSGLDEFLEIVLKSIKDEKTNIINLSRICLSSISQSLFSESQIQSKIVPVIQKISQSGGAEESIHWHIRREILPFLQILDFNHRFILSFEIHKEIHEIAVQFLSDSQIEIRELAGIALSSLLRGYEESYLISTTERFKKASQLKLPNTNDRSSKRFLLKHGGLIGLGAVVRLYPYSVPVWIPSVLMDICELNNFPIKVISDSVKHILSEFWRTHQDNWEFYKAFVFTPDQVETLTNLLISPSYYA